MNEAMQQATQAIDGKEVEVKRYQLTPLDSIHVCAEVLGISERQMRRMCERGEIAAVKVASSWRINTQRMLQQFGLN